MEDFTIAETQGEELKMEPVLEVLVSKPWDQTELILAKAKDYGPVKPSNLQATTNFPVHAFFDREAWVSLNDEDYDILQYSMQLASNLIQVGMPYLSAFVPSNRTHDHLLSTRAQDQDAYQVDPLDWTDDDLDETRKELFEIAEYVEWELNDTIAKDNKWLGITRLVTNEKWGPRPWKDLQRHDIVKSDGEVRAGGAFRRPLKVGIMQEYVNALKRYPKDSEEHLKATFLAAITMIHEIGHVVWHQDFRSMDYDEYGVEPYFSDNSISELGCSFIASIFDGKNPYECGKQVPTDFTQALFWERLPRLDTNELYRTDYSMSIPYLEKILSQESWDKFDPTRCDFVVDARAMLQPEEDLDHTFGFGIKFASAHVREWTVSQYDGANKVIWKAPFNDRRIRSDEKLKDVTEAEKELAMYEIKLANPDAFKSTNASYNSYHMRDVLTHDFDYEPDRRLIEDGVLPLDVVSSGRIDLTNPKRIEIKYKPKHGDFHNQNPPQTRARTNRHRRGAPRSSEIPYHAWFINFSTDSPPYDRNNPKDFQFGGPGQDYEPASVLEFIANKQPEVIAKTTIKEAYFFCLERNIPFGRPLPATYIEQNQIFDRTKEADRALVERIRQFCLREGEKLFEGNNQALLCIRYAAIKHIDDWAAEDLKERCLMDGLSPDGDLRVLRRRTRNHLTRWLNLFAQDHNMSASETVFRAAGLMADVDLIAWGDSDFKDFFRTNNLPSWGNERVWMERHAAFVREQKYGFSGRHEHVSLDRKGVVQRSDHGVETYAWDAVLAGSSVQALKGALLVAGHLPSDSTLKLYFGNDRSTPLDDTKPLSFYSPANWKNLTLEITRSSQAEKPLLPTLPITPPILLYSPPTSDVQHWRAAHRHPATIPTITTTPLPAVKKRRIPHDVQRIYNVSHKISQPTVSELLESIHTRANELTLIQHPQGARDILRPHLKTIKSRSVVEMLDNLRDLEEVREERGRMVDGWVDPEGVKAEIERERQEMDALGDFGKVVAKGAGTKRKRAVGGYMEDLFGFLKARA